ncbi:hypothetical protein GW916_07660, partial [bacterium]|nr:hypothetical protein [bacterium]
MMKRNAALILLSCSVLWIASCSLKEASEEAPYPSESRIEKTFFEGKTFLAGWAPISSAGAPNEVLLTYLNQTGHVNIEFEITESQLIGKAVNPSNPNKKSWKPVVTIPILKHYYLEKQRDARGRETNQWIENSSRSHFSARPYMDLDFSRIQIKDWSMAMFWQGHQVDNVFDIEWDKQKNFLGFTLSVTSAGVFANGSPQQGDFRFNFLPFEHDKTFPVTPYSLTSAKHLNVLHVLGKYEKDDPKNPVFYGSKWDTRNGQKHIIHLFGFPEEYIPIAEDVIRLWNDAFERIGQGRPFETQVGEGEYAFDLRKSAIIWIDDPKLSQHAPLGVGQAITDVRNGEIMWGKVTIWGGRLTELINNYSPNGEGTSDSKTNVQLSLMMNDQITQSAEKVFPPELQSLTSFQTVKEGLTASFGSQASGLKNLVDSIKSAGLRQAYNKSTSQALLFDPLRSWMSSLPTGQMDTQSQKSFMNLLQDQLSNSQSRLGNQELINQLANEAVLATSSLRPSEDAHRKLFSADQLQKLIGMPTLAESIEQVPINNLLAKQALIQQRSISKNTLIEAIGKDIESSSLSQSAFDTDRTVQEVAGSWNLALAQNGNVDKSKAIRSLIKDLLLHEVGHVLGLGHNFKENILPEDGTLPHSSKYYLDVKPGSNEESKLFSPQALKKIAHTNQTNYTTVMGYKNGVTDILTDYEDLMPGPSDLQVLEYLYNRKYPVYSRANKGSGDFITLDIPSDGRLQE